MNIEDKYEKFKPLKRGRLEHRKACNYVSSVNCNVVFLDKGDYCHKSYISRLSINNEWVDFITYHNKYGSLIGSSKIKVKGDL